jgi:hypothetical protein
MPYLYCIFTYIRLRRIDLGSLTAPHTDITKSVRLWLAPSVPSDGRRINPKNGKKS